MDEVAQGAYRLRDLTSAIDTSPHQTSARGTRGTEVSRRPIARERGARHSPGVCSRRYRKESAPSQGRSCRSRCPGLGQQRSKSAASPVRPPGNHQKHPLTLRGRVGGQHAAEVRRREARGLVESRLATRRAGSGSGVARSPRGRHAARHLALVTCACHLPASRHRLSSQPEVTSDSAPVVETQGYAQLYQRDVRSDSR